MQSSTSRGKANRQITTKVEGSLTSQKQLAVELENGDEEEAFSAVSRGGGRRDGETRPGEHTRTTGGRTGGGREAGEPGGGNR